MEKIDRIISHPTFVSILKELKKVETARKYCIHDMEHLLNVARIMVIKNIEENLKFEKELLYASGLLHDIGKLDQYRTNERHALRGSEIAYTILIECGFSVEDAEMIKQAIRTHSEEEPTNLLGELLRAADKLSRNCFLCAERDECKWQEEQKNRGIIV